MATATATATRRRRARAARSPSAGAASRPGRSLLMSLARTAGRRALAQRAVDGPLDSAAGVARALAQRAVEAGPDLRELASPRLPIQRSLDVAVPIRVAWEEWMRLRSLPEGVVTVRRIKRRGRHLSGRIGGRRSRRWRAEILDEREGESFAWRSTAGSDCAGLITFHRLGDRLTRLELNLDVLPTDPAATLMLGSHLAHRRAEADLRRFKARVEVIRPDQYDAD